MTYRNLLLGGVALAVISGSGAAPAQDAADTFTWNGAFIGADVGLGMGSTQRDNLAGVPDEFPVGSLGATSLAGGLFAGYDMEVAPGLVFGIQAGVDFFNDEADLTRADYAGAYEFRSMGAAYAGIRGGVQVAPRTLLYGRLSYAAIHAQTSDEAVPFTPDTTLQTFLNGYQASFGMESELTENVTLRVEGTYTQSLDRLELGDPASVGYTPAHFGAQAGVAYRFGADERGTRADLDATRSWSGGYIGAMAGGIGTSTVLGGLENTPGLGTEGPASDIALSYGGYAGVNLQVGDQWVVGLEGEVTKYDASYKYIEPNNDVGYDFATSGFKTQASARLGYLVNPDTLVYGRAGYGMMQVNPDPSEGFANVASEPGYVQTASGGLGVETMLNEHALLRVEGLYNVALEPYRFADPSDDPDTANVFGVEPNSLEARVGAAYMF